MIRLSICIATYNRVDYIGETLASIAPQLLDCVEVVVFDGASPDNTGDVVREYTTSFPSIRYVRGETNSGVDADFDRVVELAAGEHCWLFADDDVLAPGAIEAVLAELADGSPDLLVVDAEVRDVNLERRFEPARLKIANRRDYGPDDREAFLADAGDALSFIGGTIIRRSVWLSRERTAYYGSLFIHVGVIFQQPPLRHARILPKPLVRIRMGNAMWGGKSFEIWMFKWPELIWGFQGYSDEAKAKVTAREPWHRSLQLLAYRAYGSLGREQYRQWLRGRLNRGDDIFARLLLALPGKLVHVAALTLSAVSRSRRSSVTYNLLMASRYSNIVSRLIGRAIGHSLKPARKR